MGSDAKTITNPLPREMMEHTYPILYEVEQSHWWHVGRRRIIAGLVEEICKEHSMEVEEMRWFAGYEKKADTLFGALLKFLPQ